MFDAYTTTGIGSFPHRDAEKACKVILEKVDIPFWPQLPNLSFREFMIPQYSEGLPLLRIDEENQKIWIEGDDRSALDPFYEACTEESEFPLSDEYAQGFTVFLDAIQGKRLSTIKGHVTGPLTFTLGLKDGQERPVYFDEELREISLMLLRGKIRWQVRKLGEYAERVMIFLDEPVLSAIGTSAYMGVAEEEVKRLLRETVSEIKRQKGISAIHCCGKADWQLVIETGIDVVNVDAYDYFENFQMYFEAIRAFLDRGGVIAWGIVPTSADIKGIKARALREEFSRQFDALAQKVGPSLKPENVLLTPSCGTGSLNEEEAEKVFDILFQLKRSLLG